MLYYSSILSDIGSISENDLDAVPVEIQYSGVEVTVFVASAGRSTVGTTSGLQGGGVKVSNGCPICGGEGDVRSASPHAVYR